jgi:hypothetical protein
MVWGSKFTQTVLSSKAILLRVRSVGSAAASQTRAKFTRGLSFTTLWRERAFSSGPTIDSSLAILFKAKNRAKEHTCGPTDKFMRANLRWMTAVD